LISAPLHRLRLAKPQADEKVYKGNAVSVIAYHLIWTNYGTWLGNDPRGSGSTHVYAPILAEPGEVHLGRKKQQPARSTVREFYASADRLLQFPVIRFDQRQCELVAISFANTIRRQQYTCYACAIMPDHVHLVVRKHRHQGEEMIDSLQRDSRSHRQSLGIIPADHPVWTKGGWKVFLNTPAEVWSRIRYVEGNPMKEGLPRQAWPFISPYDNWPFRARRS
jgi:REP element-mobilizing transposase RayT